jgi:hypothetical protein
MDQKIKGIPRQIMPLVHEYYFHPDHEAFYPRNLWSLSNAFTSAFKKLSPVKQFEITARLGTFLTAVQNDLGPNFETVLPVLNTRPTLTLAVSNASVPAEVVSTEAVLTGTNSQNESGDDSVNDNDQYYEELDSSNLKELEEELNKEYLQKIR